MSERAAPFYCPYCGDEDLRPFGEAHGQWRCGACRRVFTLKYVGAARSWQALDAAAGSVVTDDADTRHGQQKGQ